MPASSLEQIVSLAKRRGFVFPSSAVYGGLGSTWDYGPLGVELKNNVKRAWWRSVVHERDDMEGLDAAILMNRLVWKYSGHEATFSDPMTDCRNCKARPRADHVFVAQKGHDPKGLPEINAAIAAKELKCPKCWSTDLTVARPFNLMFRTNVGPVDTGDDTGLAYLRPETAQGIFVNFGNVLDTMRRKLPFGVAQVGKSFRNEITPGNFTFRTREFEQMEIEYFCKPGTEDDHFDRWVKSRFDWYVKFGIRKENLRLRDHDLDTLKLKDGTTVKAKAFDRGDHYQAIARGLDRKILKSEVASFERGELAHYAKACTDVEYLFPMGWSELEGIASRTDYDLTQHSKFSGKTLDYFDEETKQRFVPYVVEPAAGADRAALAFLVDAYREEEVKGEKRIVLGFHPEIAPIKVAVLPLLKKNDKIVATSKAIVTRLRDRWNTVYDDTAAIGRLYRRQDEI